MARVLGIDYGRRRIGLAIASSELGIARPLTTLKVSDTADAVRQIAAAVREEGVNALVMGLPLHMSGEESDMAREVRQFATRIEQATGLSVALSEERWSSLEAERSLRGSGLRGAERKARIDAMAAQLVLQTHLDRQRRAGEQPAE